MSQVAGSQEARGQPLGGRVALVTGSSRGIGRGIAFQLAAEGAAVAVQYLTRSAEAAEVAAAIERTGGRAITVGGDVGDPDAVGAQFARIEGELGAVDVLVNNAGVHRGGRIEKVELEEFELVFRTTLFGALHCVRRALPHMRERQWGRIINVSSVVARRGSPGDAAYASAKAALLGLTRSLAAELAGEGITANAVLPGLVLTEMTRGLSERAQQRNLAAIPMRRDGTPEEVASAVAYLASPAAAYVTGVELPVDGGLLG
jgi:3-oxoacyl-[acyl-carrier protein] reductase